MSLPDKFQMRTNTHPGFTHTVKRNAWGDYEVNWARGYHNVIHGKPRVTWDQQAVEERLQDLAWNIVDEQKAEKEAAKAPVKESLPDVFHFVMTGSNDTTVFKATKGDDKYVVSWTEDYGRKGQTNYSVKMVQNIVSEGGWTVVEKTPITAEQQRLNKELNEQIAALQSSVRISEQNVEHQRRLQANYNERIDALKSKLVEEA
jgi:hypothetical protein